MKGTGLQAHHIIEKRFAEVLGLKSDFMSSVALTREQHQAFTNAWREWFPYGITDYASLTKDKIWEAAQNIYKEIPELLEATRNEIFK